MDYLVSDTDLTSVADAIRAKGGTSAQLSFPNGFNTAIANIPSGGSSDFTTCTITVINDSEEAYDLYIPYVVEEDLSGDPASAANAWSNGMGSTDTCTCILYKGRAIGQFNDNSFPRQSEVTTSGGITYDADSNIIEITGDGTLTINY